VETGIAADEQWWSRLTELIAVSEAMVFVVSPDSVASAVCGDEIRLAQRLGKKIIPVLLSEVDLKAAPPDLASLNIAISFLDPKLFENSLRSLCSVLDSDLIWLRESARLTSSAMNWLSSDRPASLLLSSGGLARAILHLESRPVGTTETGPTVIEFLEAAIEAELGPAIIFDRRHTVLAVNSAFNSLCNLGGRIISGTVSYQDLLARWKMSCGSGGNWEFGIQEQLSKVLESITACEYGSFNGRDDTRLEYQLTRAGSEAAIVRFEDITEINKGRQERFNRANIASLSHEVKCAVVFASLLQFKSKGGSLQYTPDLHKLLPPERGEMNVSGCCFSADEMRDFQFEVLSFDTFALPPCTEPIALQPAVAKVVDVMSAALTGNADLNMRVYGTFEYPIDEACLKMAVMTMLVFIGRMVHPPATISINIQQEFEGTCISVGCETDPDDDSYDAYRLWDYVAHLVKPYGASTILGGGGPAYTRMAVLFKHDWAKRRH
jgi:hypothetical protein